MNFTGIISGIFQDIKTPYTRTGKLAVGIPVVQGDHWQMSQKDFLREGVKNTQRGEVPQI